MAQGTPKIKVALIGYGQIAKAALIPAIAADDSLQLIAVADPELSKRDSALPLDTAVYEHATRLLHVERPDVVVVATPTTTRIDVLTLLAELRLPTLCEKPLVSSSQELLSLRAAWQGRYDSIKVVHNYVYSPARLAARAHLASGRFGSWLETEVLVPIPKQYGRGTNDWRGSPLSGGPALDLGYHYLYLAEFLSDQEIETIEHRREGISEQIVATHSSGGRTRIRFDRVTESSPILRIVCAHGTVCLRGARRLSFSFAAEATQEEAYPAELSDGYAEMIKDTARSRKRDADWRGHFVNGYRLLATLWNLSEPELLR